MDTIKTVQAVQCLRQSEEESAAVVSDIVVVVVIVFVVVVAVVVVVVVVVDSTLTSKLALTIVFPWRIFSSHKPLQDIFIIVANIGESKIYNNNKCGQNCHFEITILFG